MATKVVGERKLLAPGFRIEGRNLVHGQSLWSREEDEGRGLADRHLRGRRGPGLGPARLLTVLALREKNGGGGPKPNGPPPQRLGSLYTPTRS